MARTATANVLREVADERAGQDARTAGVEWGGNHPSGTGREVVLDGGEIRLEPHREQVRRERAVDARRARETAAREHRATWRHILVEEVAEACAGEGDALRAELIQIAAVAVAWIECLDRKAG